MKSLSRLFAFGAAALCFFAANNAVQGQSVQDSLPQTALRVFLDCRFCDDDHIRQEVAFINYVRDRRDAQVHVLGTSQETGGGRVYTFEFIGLREFLGRNDTLSFNTSQTDTRDEIRDAQTLTFSVGILRYAIETPVGADVGLRFQFRQRQAAINQERDPWNNWVFRIGAGGSFFAESSQEDWSIDGNLSANRVTEDWKIEFFTFGEYERERSELSDTTFVTVSRGFAAEGLIVRSAGEHWGYGGAVEVSGTTFENRDLLISAGLAVEYSLFPYSESTRRQLIALYTIGISYFDWEEVTIFERLSETRATHRLELAYRVLQPWGDLNAGLEGRAYLHDPKLHRLEASVGFGIRLLRGLRINGRASFARIKDQIFLPLEELTDEEILVRQRQIGTDFRARLNFGFNYTFGSIFNSVVNPRLNRF